MKGVLTLVVVKMSKALIVNGLHRSGTTMLERIIDSQPEMVCFSLAFQIVQMIAEMRNVGGKEAIMSESFTEGKNVITSASHESLRNLMALSLLNSIIMARRISGGFDKQRDSSTYFGLKWSQITDLISLIYDYGPIDDVASLFQKIGGSVDKRIVGVRWTAHHRYAPVFLKTPDAYWLEIVRNPYSRRVSEKLSHGGYAENIYNQVTDAFDFYRSFKHERYKLIRYEDLCERPDEILAEISIWLNETVENIELINPLGNPFEANTSKKILSGKDMFEKTNIGTNRIGGIDPDRWHGAISIREIALINYNVSLYPFYEPLKTSFLISVLAALEMSRIRGVRRLKDFFRSVIWTTGFTVQRKPVERKL